MSRAFRVTIDFVEVSHSELPPGKFEVRVTSDGIYLRATAARRWRFLSWEDAAISASWSEAPRSRAVADELAETEAEPTDPMPPAPRCPEPDAAALDTSLRQFLSDQAALLPGMTAPSDSHHGSADRE